MDGADGPKVLDETQVLEPILDVLRHRCVGSVRVRLPLEPQFFQCVGKSGPRHGLSQGRQLEQIVEPGGRVWQKVVLEDGLSLAITVATKEENPARARFHAEVADDHGDCAPRGFGQPVAEDFIPGAQTKPVPGGNQHRLADHLPVEQELDRPLDVVDVVRARRPSQGDDRPRIVTAPGLQHDQSATDGIVGISQTIGVGLSAGRIGVRQEPQDDSHNRGCNDLGLFGRHCATPDVANGNGPESAPNDPTPD